jgi:hypothetical protein
MPERELTIEVLCERLPSQCLPHEPIFLGIQKGREVVAVVPASQGRAMFHPTFRVTAVEGRPNFLGPYAQGKREERFFYLSWGTKSDDGPFEMFRRLKVHLTHLSLARIGKATEAGGSIRVTLNMTDACGGALCGSAWEGERAQWHG